MPADLDFTPEVGALAENEALKFIYDLSETVLMGRGEVNTWWYAEKERLDELLPLPPKLDSVPLDDPIVSPWRRFFARIFDIWWEVSLVAALVAMVLSLYSARFAEWSSGNGASILFGIICLPVALVFDAALYRLFGNTPGKALLGLKVKRLDGSLLSFSEYLIRNLAMWISGFAFGIPLVNLFTMNRQESRLREGMQTSYDEGVNYRVSASPIGWSRKCVFTITFVVLLLVAASLDILALGAER